MVNWSELFDARRDIAERFGSVWDLPIRRRYHEVLGELGGRGSSVLEIGAGERKLETRLKSAWGTLDYASCDIDRRRHHDFYDIADVTGTFDLICALEVIEHLRLEQARDLLSGCFAHSRTDGKIALTTPNIFYPPGFLRDATHVTAFGHDELGGLLTMAGYHVTEIYRLYHDSIVKKLIKRYLFYPIFRTIGIDFAHQIIVVGERRS